MNNNYNNNFLSLREAAGKLNIKGVGLQNLCWYLREMNIFQTGNIPKHEYVIKGYFTITRGSRNKTQKITYPTTLVTEKGLTWLLTSFGEKIREEHETYLTDLKNKK